MANIKSQIKRNRQNEKRRLRNRGVRTEIKTRSKRVIEAAESGADNAEELYRQAQQRIDAAVSKGVIHKNTAARKKAQLAKKLNAAG